MKNIIKFIARLIIEIKKDNLLSISYELTYKLLLALFPFLIFAISFLGFLDLDSSIIMNIAMENLPADAVNIIKLFIEEVIHTRSPKILSSSLIIAMISSSSGFVSVINGINRAYGNEEKRGFIKVRILSIAMVFLFSVMLAFSVTLLIFGDTIKNFLAGHNFPEELLSYLFGFSTYLGTLLVLLLVAMLIFKLASCRRVSFFSVLPGSIVTVLFWVISSKIFSIYINNFSKYSTIYGSIGSVFILMFWINIISFFLLVGGEVNALVEVKKESE